jgi:hypothetical protein
MHLSIQRKVRYMASSILGPVIVVLTTSSRAIIISAPILFYNKSTQEQIELTDPQAAYGFMQIYFACGVHLILYWIHRIAQAQIWL